MNNITLYYAIEALENAAPVKVEWLEPKKLAEHADGNLVLTTLKHKYTFVLALRKEIRTIHIPKLVVLKEQYNKLLVVAQVIYPNIGKQLQERKINYLDTLGNIYIQQEELLLKLKGEKAAIPFKNKTGRAFNKAGLKFIFHLLTQKDFIHKTYREMAEICETALGNINYIIKDLQKLGYIVKHTRKTWQVKNREALIAAWTENYENKLKTTCLLGTFRFQHQEDIKRWRNLKIQDTKTLWGGEPAADVLTNYLQPATLTLYTDEKRIDLIKNLRLVPDTEGNIGLYTKFWKTTDTKYKTVHPLIIYADLLGIEDPRTDELASMIYDEYLKE